RGSRGHPRDAEEPGPPGGHPPRRHRQHDRRREDRERGRFPEGDLPESPRRHGPAHDPSRRRGSAGAPGQAGGQARVLERMPMMLRTLALVFALSGAAAAAQEIKSDDLISSLESTYSKVCEKAGPAVVGIRVDREPEPKAPQPPGPRRFGMPED